MLRPHPPVRLLINDPALQRRNPSQSCSSCLVTPTLETLSLLFVDRSIHPAVYRLNRTTVLSWLAFPRLTQLTLRGVKVLPRSPTFASGTDAEDAQPADESIPPRFDEFLASNHPHLTHLRISCFSNIQEHYDTAMALVFVMRVNSSREGPSLTSTAKLARLPEDISRVYLLKPGLTPDDRWSESSSYPRAAWVKPHGYDDMISLYSRCATTLPNFALLPEHPGYVAVHGEVEEAREQWVDRIDGGAGCWFAPGREYLTMPDYCLLLYDMVCLAASCVMPRGAR